MRESRHALFGRIRNLVSLDNNDVELVTSYLKYSIYLSTNLSFHLSTDLSTPHPSHTPKAQEGDILYFLKQNNITVIIIKGNCKYTREATSCSAAIMARENRKNARAIITL